MAGLLTHKRLWRKANPIYHSDFYNDINEYSDTWKDSGSDSEDEFQTLRRKCNNIYSMLLPNPVSLRRSVSFDMIAKVILIPEAKEYDNIKDLIWYSEEELHEFVLREIDIRKKEIEEQKKELDEMRNEEIYTIMIS